MHEFYTTKYKSVPNVDKGEGVKKSKNFADIISGSSLTMEGEIDISSHCRFPVERPQDEGGGADLAAVPGADAAHHRVDHEIGDVFAEPPNRVLANSPR